MLPVCPKVSMPRTPTSKQVSELLLRSIRTSVDQKAGGNILTDLFYSLGPLYYLSRVRVSVYNKWALRGVFMIGLVATICSIAKCEELPKLKSSTDPTCKSSLFVSKNCDGY